MSLTVESVTTDEEKNSIPTQNQSIDDIKIDFAWVCYYNKLDLPKNKFI